MIKIACTNFLKSDSSFNNTQTDPASVIIILSVFDISKKKTKNYILQQHIRALSQCQRNTKYLVGHVDDNTLTPEASYTTQSSMHRRYDFGHLLWTRRFQRGTAAGICRSQNNIAKGSISIGSCCQAQLAVLEEYLSI